MKKYLISYIHILMMSIISQPSKSLSLSLITNLASKANTYSTIQKRIMSRSIASSTTSLNAASGDNSKSDISRKFNIAIIGGGITGATAAQTLSNHGNFNIHLFDQGRRGVGGRTSSRAVDNKSDQLMRWDHGCQFFRGDTPQFQPILNDWKSKNLVCEWKGKFISSSTTPSPDKEFFGLPSQPPFYVGMDGMQSIAKGIVDHIMASAKDDDESAMSLFAGTRVAQLERDKETKRWKLYGTSGEAAFHDTPNKIVHELQQQQHSTTTKGNDNNDNIVGESTGYDGVILTDVSSSFGKWHRASAGVPESFAQRVRHRVGARVPLFTAMIAFEKESDIPFDAATFDNDIAWFAAKSNSKPGMADGNTMKECWTIVSTPEYAVAQIEKTPMQDPKTGEFIPQSKDYLTAVPGPDLSNAFCEEVLRTFDSVKEMPKIVFLDAQRWGSAMPSHRHLTETSETRKVISGVPYESGRSPLAPTKEEQCLERSGNNDGDCKSRSFLVDNELMLLQAGDMMSRYTPGLEGAALSGHDAAEYLARKLSNK